MTMKEIHATLLRHNNSGKRKKNRLSYYYTFSVVRYKTSISCCLGQDWVNSMMKFRCNKLSRVVWRFGADDKNLANLLIIYDTARYVPLVNTYPSETLLFHIQVTNSILVTQHSIKKAATTPGVQHSRNKMAPTE